MLVDDSNLREMILPGAVDTPPEVFVLVEVATRSTQRQACRSGTWVTGSGMAGPPWRVGAGGLCSSP